MGLRVSVAVGLPLFCLCLAPTGARAGTITFNLAESGQGNYYTRVGNLSWSSGANWAGGLPPAAGDDVNLISLDPTVMNFDAGTLALNSLTISSVCCGNMSLFVPAGAALTAGSETIEANGNITQDGGTNTVTGTLALTGTGEYQIYGGTLTANTINSSSRNSFFEIENAGGAPTLTYQTFNNTGDWYNFGATISQSGAGVAFLNQQGGELSNSGNFNNLAGGTFTNTGAGTSLSNSGNVTNDGVGTNLYNKNGAQLYNEGGDPPALNNQNGATLTNEGTGTLLYNSAATLTNTGNGTNLYNQNGATLTNTGTGTSLVNENGATLTNSGTLNNENHAVLTNNATIMNSGAVTLSGNSTLNGTGTYTQTAGSTLINAGTSFTQHTLNLQGGSFTVDGTATITGNAINSGGNLTISGPGANMTVMGAYFQLGAGSRTLLAGGTFDPPAIDIEGGTFGGTGTVDGPVTLTGDSTLQVGNPTGELLISGDYSQTDGEILFEVQSDGDGGFLESTLGLGSGLDINGANIVFDFENGAVPAAFSDEGLFNITTFLTGIDEATLLADFAGFSGDTFTLEGTGLPTTALNYDSANGDLTFSPYSSVPEPGTPFLLLTGLGILGFVAARRKRLSQRQKLRAHKNSGSGHCRRCGGWRSGVLVLSRTGARRQGEGISGGPAG